MPEPTMEFIGLNVEYIALKNYVDRMFMDFEQVYALPHSRHAIQLLKKKLSSLLQRFSATGKAKYSVKIRIDR